MYGVADTRCHSLTFTGRFEEKLNSSHVRIMKLAFMLLMLAHWNGESYTGLSRASLVVHAKCKCKGKARCAAVTLLRL